MASRKKQPKNEDVIEGVVVEKTTAESGRSTHGKDAGKEKSNNKNAGSAAGGATADRSADQPAREKTASRKSSSTSWGMGLLPVILSLAALLGVGVLAAYQLQVKMAGEAALRTQIDRLQARLDEIEGRLVSDGDQLSELLAGLQLVQEGMQTRLTGIEDSIPADPQERFASLENQLLDLQFRVEAAAPAGNMPLSALAAGPELMLAQAGLSTAIVMNAEYLRGGDAARWLPVLHQLADAGLVVGDLDSLAATLMPPPLSRQMLLQRAASLALVPEVPVSARGETPAAGDTGGWFDRFTARLAGFVRLRESGSEPAVALPPTDAFEAALAIGSLDQLYTASAAFSANADVADWRQAVMKRRQADQAIAGFMMVMVDQLTRALETVNGGGG